MHFFPFICFHLISYKETTAAFSSSIRILLQEQDLENEISTTDLEPPKKDKRLM